MANNQNPIVTEDMLSRWKAEDTRLEAEERAIKAKRNHLKQLIEAGTNLSQGFALDVMPEAGESKKSSTMKEAIVLFLAGIPTGTSAAYVMEEMNKYPEYKERIQRNPNAVYSDLNELLKTDRLLKWGSSYLHPKFSGKLNDLI